MAESNVGDDRPTSSVAPVTIPGTQRTGTLPAAPKAIRGGITLAENLVRTERHPVLIFGSSKSGKSSLIMSLIRALQTDPDTDIQFGEPVLDQADPRVSEKHAIARQFYDWQAYQLDLGQNLKATQGDPFFIPIDIRPKNSTLPAVKLALLDGRGEGYEPVEDEKAGDLFKALNDDVRGVLETFPYGLTVIFVAPYAVGSNYFVETNVSNTGLLGALHGYREFRQGRRKEDFLLFLLSKWDQKASPTDADALFARPRPSDVNRILNDRYQRSWGDFQALPLEGPAFERRAFMQYSSGYFIGDQPRPPPPGELEHEFSRYPRTVLNWLYGNATRLQGRDGSPTLRRILFEDVIPPDRPRITVTDRIAKLLTAR